MAVTETDFAPGASLHELGLQLQLWASLRCDYEHTFGPTFDL